MTVAFRTCTLRRGWRGLYAVGINTKVFNEATGTSSDVDSGYRLLCLGREANTTCPVE